MKKHSGLTHLLHAFFVLWCVSVLASCVYKLDIQQGNILERDQVAQLKIGMTKRQVRYLLGTPLIIDTFNPDRWDYYYSLKGYGPTHRKETFSQERLTLFFDKDQLSKIDSHLPTDAVAAPDHQDSPRDMTPTPEAIEENRPQAY